MKRLSASNVTPLTDQNVINKQKEKVEKSFTKREPIEIESIEEIISQIKKNCENSQKNQNKENVSEDVSLNISW